MSVKNRDGSCVYVNGSVGSPLGQALTDRGEGDKFRRGGYKTISDEDLIAASYACDDAAFAAIWQRYRARLEQSFRSGGLREADAQDRAEDVFVRVMETKHGRGEPFDPRKGASFKTWLFTTATRLLIDTLRRQGRTVDFSSLEVEGCSVSSGTGQVPTLPCPLPPSGGATRPRRQFP